MLVVPEQLPAPEREDPAQDQLGDALGMGLGIGQRQRAAPGAAEHQPALDPEHGAQPLDVGHQMPGGVGLQRGEWCAAAAAALVEQEDPVALGIEQPAMLGAAAAARPAMQEHGGLAGGVAADLPKDAMAIADVEVAMVVGLDRRVEVAHRHAIRLRLVVRGHACSRPPAPGRGDRCNIGRRRRHRHRPRLGSLMPDGNSFVKFRHAAARAEPAGAAAHPAGRVAPPPAASRAAASGCRRG